VSLCMCVSLNVCGLCEHVWCVRICVVCVNVCGVCVNVYGVSIKPNLLTLVWAKIVNSEMNF